MNEGSQDSLPAPARITFTSPPVTEWRSWESFVPSAEVAGRALIEACATPPAQSDPGVLDQLARRAVKAAAAVAGDNSVPGPDRAAAAADARRVVEVVAAAHERAEVRRSRWLSSVVRVVGVLALGLALIRVGAAR